MFEILEKLCNLDGTSGDEKAVRDFIIGEIKDYCEYRIDNLGNIIAFKKGKNKSAKKLMIDAHMDEVGLIITSVTSEGFLKFKTVGGIDVSALMFRNVMINGKLNGVISGKPVHLASSEERKKLPKEESLYIDIGADSKEEAEKLVSIGDSVHFKSDYVEFGNNKIKAKAIDDRFGCAIMLKMLQQELEYDTYFAFLVQEEVGCRGAGPAVWRVRPDYAIVLEATTASDIAFVDDENTVCRQGEGAVVSFMDRSTVYDMELFKGAFEIAKEKGIKIQPKTTVAGGNDAGTIHKSCEGVRTIAVSLPCRYIHSGTCVADKRDMNACYDLAKALVEEYANA